MMNLHVRQGDHTVFFSKYIKSILFCLIYKYGIWYNQQHVLHFAIDYNIYISKAQSYILIHF